jgi:hypothetical protein
MFRFTIQDMLWLTALAAICFGGARLSNEGQDALLPGACVFTLAVVASFLLSRYDKMRTK